MTKQDDNPAPVPGFIPPEQIDQITAFNTTAMEAFTKASRAYVSGMAAVNGEVFRFVTQRLRHDVEVGQSLAGCEDFSKAASLQQEWARKAMDDYMAEAGRLMELASKATTESWEPLYQGIGGTIGESKKTTAKPAKKVA